MGGEITISGVTYGGAWIAISCLLKAAVGCQGGGKKLVGSGVGLGLPRLCALSATSVLPQASAVLTGPNGNYGNNLVSL